MTDTPLLLLDVDGVLNACSDVTPKTWVIWRRGRASAGPSSWPILWAPACVTALQELHEAKLVEIVWLTTWADEANDELLELLEFPRPFEVLAAPDEERWIDLTRRDWWKFEAVKQGVPVDRPLIWCDDDLSAVQSAMQWVNERTAPTLAISPDTHVGLTPEHINMIREFAV